VLLLAVLIGGWLFLLLMTPRVVRLEDLSAGACLHVPTSANGDVTAASPVGTPGEVADVLARSGADVAPCDGSHSHEVAGVFTEPDPAGAAYPGQPALEQRHQAACEASFASYVGHPLAGSALELTVVVQAEAGWSAGRRAGACLVSGSDGKFLTSRAGGSGR
jgi:Septum formation